MQIRCRNCGRLDTLPDYHGPTLVTCPACRWQEMYPARRHIKPDLEQAAGRAFDARAERRRELGQVFAHICRLSARDFERFCAEMFEKMGYEVMAADQTLDTSHALELRWEDKLTFVACRAGAEPRPVDREEIENLSGSMRHGGAGKAIYVTTGAFTDECAGLAEPDGIELVDGEGLLDRLEHMDDETLARWEAQAAG